MVVRAPSTARPPKVVTLGAAAIGHDRPNPLFGRQHVMENEAPKVEQAGVYTLVDGTPVRLKEGDVLPMGATFRDAGRDPAESPRARERRLIAEAAGATPVTAAPEPAGEERAKGAAPENRAKAAAPEKKAEG